MKTALLLVFVAGVVLYVVFGLRRKTGDSAAPSGNDGACDGGDACGVSCFCDDKALKRQMSEEIVYFEDEELDAYRGVSADAYSDAQVEEFSEVLTTLKPYEVADWLHSLELRHISLPEALKDEVAIMMEQ